MAHCERCGEGPGKYSYNCNYCGHEFCSDHRLPEHHDCHGTTSTSDNEAIMNQSRSSAQQRHETVASGGVRRSSAGEDSQLLGRRRRWIYILVLAVLITLIAVVVTLGPLSL